MANITKMSKKIHQMKIPQQAKENLKYIKSTIFFKNSQMSSSHLPKGSKLLEATENQTINRVRSFNGENSFCEDNHQTVDSHHQRRRR